jgi:amidohydrolase
MRTGTLGWTKGVTYALADEFKVSVKGRGCHGSTPHLGRDPITAAALIISAINTIVSRRVASSDRVVVSFGMVEGGTAFNIVPDLVRIVGTVRTLDPRLRGRVRRWLDGAVRHAAAAAGVSAGFEYHEGYPLLVSDSSVVDAGIAAANEVFGAGNVEESLPSMGGEDFAYFLRKAPGAMFRLGCSRTGRNMPLHNVEFSPDENALILGVEFLCRFALRYLAGMEVVAAPS